jgi:hypothetical protein
VSFFLHRPPSNPQNSHRNARHSARPKRHSAAQGAVDRIFVAPGISIWYTGVKSSNGNFKAQRSDARRRKEMAAKPKKERQRDHFLGRGMAIGMVLFTPVGLVLSIATDTPGLIGVGPALGVGVGVAIGEGLYRRHLQEQEGRDREGH